MVQIVYGEHTIETDKLPAKSIEALLRRGVSHFLGNEQASKVSAKFADQENVTDEQKAQAKAEYVAAAIKALHEGTIGNVIRGPKGTSADAIMRELARKEVTDILRQNKLTFPTGDKVVEFGDGTKLTGKELVDRRIAKHGERLRKEAEAELKARERKAAKEGGNLAEALL
jgi:hypothetical protein